jgi:hypothetical protein
VNGDRGVEFVTRGQRLVIVDELNGEQLLAHHLMAIREWLITVEAAAVLAPLGDLGHRQALDGG